jgi:hypothetical protein
MRAVVTGGVVPSDKASESIEMGLTQEPKEKWSTAKSLCNVTPTVYTTDSVEYRVKVENAENGPHRSV